jgi:hypothetical protein
MSPRPVQSYNASLHLLTSLTTALANDTRPANPFADPKHDPFNPLKYIASNKLTAVALTFILLSGLIQSWSIRKWGAKWMLSMVIGQFTFALGIAMRFGLHSHPDSKGIYIIEYLLVVLSPNAFIAADYVLLGRLSQYTDCNECLLVRSSRITRLFISSDITTFLIQAIGGGISASANDGKAVKSGSHIFLAGLALQLVSFLVFSCIYVVFLLRVRKSKPDAWNLDGEKPWYRDWRTLAGALLVSCVGILIRSVYRTIELSQGFQGALATNEAFFYGLDTLPLLICFVVYVPFWPGRFLPPVLDNPPDSEKA